MTATHYAHVLARYLAPYRKTAAWIGGLLILDVAFSIAWPLSFKYIIDDITTTNDRSFLTYAVMGLFLAVMLASLMDIMRCYGYALLASKVKRDVRRSVFRHLQDMSMTFFRQSRSVDLLAHFSNDLALLETAVTSGMASFLLGSVGIVISTALLFFLEWHLALLTALGLVLCVVVPRPLIRAAVAAHAPLDDLESDLGNVAKEIILAQPVVKAFALGDRFMTEFNELTESLSAHAMKFKFLTNVIERAPNLVILTFQVLVMGFGLLLVAGGERTLGTIIAFQGVFLYVVRSVQILTQVIPVLLESITAIERVEEILHKQPDVRNASGAKTQRPLQDSIRFHKVSFSYGAAQQQIEQVELTIPCGKFVAFVGVSGSGKSTMLNLIIRFYDPQAGKITFDGTDIREATVESLRGHMGVVFQSSDLFNLNLRENIRLGWPAATDDEVEAAARQAEIHQWISAQPHGYDTLAGECGSNLSGGQRQRVAIARALVRRPQILLLDEATSALDPDAEAAINETLRRLSAGRTVVFVTHRLSTVHDADCIYVMGDGRVVESGKHDDLLSAKGPYAKLWHRQSGFTVNKHGDEAEVDPKRLRDYPLLSEMTPGALDQLAQFFVAESYPADRNVVTEGELGDRFYLIARGKVQVLQNEGGEQKKVAVLEDGDYFGEVALIRRVPRTATVRTLVPTLLLSLRDTHFQALLTNQPELKTRFQNRGMAVAGSAPSP